MTDQLTDEKPAPAPDMHPETRQGLLLPIVIPIGTFLGIGLVLFGFSRVLLSVSPAAATVIALIVAASILGVATIVASRERLSNGTLFSMIGVVAGVAMLAGGIAIVAIGTGEETGGGGGPQTVALAAPKGAAATGFQPTALSVAANEPVELDFSNQDPGIQHNVVIFDVDPAKNPDAQPLFSGSLTSGPSETTYAVPALPAGTLFFHCEVHPTTMVGTIESAEGGGGGGGPAGPTVTAKSLAFDTDEIALPAGQPTTITFDNQDAGVPHNIAIYNDDSLSETLFQGEQFPGVDSREYQIPPLDPGTYYFHCDVHNTMNGSVVVGAPGGGSGPGGTGPSGASGAAPSG